MTSNRTVSLPSGTIHYRDVGRADGPILVFVHGLLVHGSLWDGVVARLAADHRCIVPDWPLGSHRTPMKADADLSPEGVARIVASFLEALDLDDVTLVGNDSGGALCQIAMTETDARKRVAALVLTTCDAFEIFPPSPFHVLVHAARAPSIFRLSLRALRAFPRLQTLPLAYGRLAKHGLDRALVDAWLEPSAEDAAVNRDLCKFLRALGPASTLRAAKRLKDVDVPALVLWSPEDRSFPLSLGERLSKVLPQAELELVDDAWVFSAIDQPAKVAASIGAFVGRRAAGRRRSNDVRTMAE